MKSESEDKLISNLKEKIDSFIQKGISISKDLSVNDNERDSIIKMVADEIIDKVREKIAENGEDIYGEDELLEREKKLRQIIEKQFQKRINEMSK